jgi:hypothetical protein
MWCNHRLVTTSTPIKALHILPSKISNKPLPQSQSEYRLLPHFNMSDWSLHSTSEVLRSFFPLQPPFLLHSNGNLPQTQSQRYSTSSHSQVTIKKHDHLPNLSHVLNLHQSFFNLSLNFPIQHVRKTTQNPSLNFSHARSVRGRVWISCHPCRFLPRRLQICNL